MDSSRQRVIELDSPFPARRDLDRATPILALPPGIAPDAGIWTPERGRRRRARLGPPLCSTTFGGHTVPPLFTGGGAGGAIFLRGGSSFYDKSVDGEPFTVVAPARNVDDVLLFIKAGFGQNIVPPAGWASFIAPASGNLRIFQRLATNTAADDFDVTEVSTRVVVGQMAVIGNTLGETTLFASYQGGGALDNVGGAGLTTFDVLDIAAGPFRANNLVIGYWMRERNFGVNPSAVSITQPSFLANNISSTAASQGSPIGRIYCGWELEAEAGSSPLISGGSIAYSPVEDFSVTTSQMVRMDYV